MFCRKCGQQIEGSVKFCRNCGTPVPEKAELQSSLLNQDEGTKTLNPVGSNNEKPESESITYAVSETENKEEVKAPESKICKNCGQQIAESMKFCRNCGTAVQEEAVTQPPLQNQITYGASNGANHVGNKKNVKKKSSKLPIVIVSCVLALLILLGGGFLAYKFLLSDEEETENKKEKRETQSVSVDTSGNKEDEEKTKEKEQANAARKKMEQMSTFLDDTISVFSEHDSVSVSIIDNKAHIQYGSIEANSQYSAWGFYLPIYLAYKDSTTSPDPNLLAGVMSSDAGVCNQAGNTIIQTLGGTSGVTSFIQNNYHVSVTSYGRLFAQSNPTADNYTSAHEAVSFLLKMTHGDEYTKLSYNLNKFGITAPSGAMVYAQIGTENNAVRKNLNLFAIVKGEKSDYCIAILTKNGAGKDMSNLLQTIHSEMERVTE